MTKVVLPPSPDPLRRFGFLWLPFWQTDRLRRDTAEFPDRPLVTSMRDGPRLVVSAACIAARRLGLHQGMKLAQAQAMVPALVVVPAREEADAKALTVLAGWCRRYTPATRAEPPDGIWLDLTGCAHLFGGEDPLLLDLSRRLRRAGLSMRVAAAPTPGAAYAVARHGKRAARSVPSSRLSAVLEPLPVEALRLDPEEAALLHRFGLRTVGALEAVPRGPLTRRLGTQPMLRLDQAYGRVAEPVRPDLPAAAMQEGLVFAEPLQGAESLAAANALLADRLCRRLDAACLGARRLELVLVRLDGSTCVQRVGLARASRARQHLGRLLDERLDRIDPGEGIEAMWLLACVAEPLAAEQASLSDQQAPSALSPLIDTLRNRLGPDRLWRPVPVESDVPERSVHRGGFETTPGGSSWPACLPRPVRLVDPPQKVLALAELPDQAPAAFTWRRRRHRVVKADGPERIAGEWWLRGSELFAMRDYFRVEDEDGRRFWLFRRGNGVDPATGDLGWFLHGLF